MILDLRRAAAIVSAVTLAGCGLSSPLSRDEAASIIRSSEPFARPHVARIPSRIYVSSTWVYGQSGEGPLSMSDLARIDPTVSILKLRGLIDISEMTTPGQYHGANHLLTITPSHLDAALLAPDSGDDPASGAGARVIERARVVSPFDQRGIERTPGWTMPIGTRVFGRVEQIHNWKDVNVDLAVNQLAVDFSWHWKPDEAGDPFDSESAAFQSLPDTVQEMARITETRMNTAAPQLSRAFLERAGDRWVLRSVTWSFGRGNAL